MKDEVSVEQDVEIEGARAIEYAGRAVAAEFALDEEERVEERGRGEIGFEGHDSVDEARLRGESHRRGGVKGGTADDAADGGKAIDGGGEGSLRRPGGTSDVGAHPDVSGLHVLRVTRTRRLAGLHGRAF